MPKKLTAQEKAWRAVTEKQFQTRLIQAARLHEWKICHFADSRKQVKPGVFVGDKDASGFPDLAAAHPKHGFICIELKTELGKLKDEQAQWLDALYRSGVRSFVARPSMEREVLEYFRLGFPDPLDPLYTLR